jgi:cytochrome c553
MRHHFSQVFVIHEALIRGDLAAVRQPARDLAQLPAPTGLPDGAAPFVANLRSEGRHAADASTLAEAATATSRMLTQCGDCHRAVGAVVAVTTPGGHDVGGIVGHMLEHQRAADDMLQGLFAPSASQWRQGADGLRVAALQPAQMPSDPKLTATIRAAESRLHALAKEAAGDMDAHAREARYAQVLVTCAECHVLHSRIWGPARGMF